MVCIMVGVVLLLIVIVFLICKMFLSVIVFRMCVLMFFMEVKFGMVRIWFLKLL